MGTVDVYSCGRMVEMKIGGVVAMITSVLLSFDSVKYELTHVTKNRKIQKFWATENEFTII